jgi:hypothetical protein
MKRRDEQMEKWYRAGIVIMVMGILIFYEDIYGRDRLLAKAFR